MAAEHGKSKVLVIGSTGFIGKYIVRAGARLGHPTFALVRELSPSDGAKAALLQSFQDAGVTLLQGDLYDHDSLVRALKQVDVVVSTVGFGQQLADQVKIIDAIKEAGNIKRFLPSEFGSDVDHAHALEPAKSLIDAKVQVRRAIEAAGVPYTYIVSNGFAGYIFHLLGAPGEPAPPREKVVIVGDGNAKAVFVEEDDIATYTINAVDDPRTLNKTLHMRPAANTLSFNDLVLLWEKKIGKTLQRDYLPEEELLQIIQESPAPLNLFLSLRHAVFVKGDHTNFEIEPSFGVEATALYPDVRYTTVDELLSRFV